MIKLVREIICTYISEHFFGFWNIKITGCVMKKNYEKPNKCNLIDVLRYR